jgi:hypothetical protein
MCKNLTEPDGHASHPLGTTSFSHLNLPIILPLTNLWSSPTPADSIYTNSLVETRTSDKDYLSTLAAEIREFIMLELDPVSCMCLGLTCRAMHESFHTLYRPYEYPPEFNYYHPFSLMMQASVCGTFVLNWPYYGGPPELPRLDRDTSWYPELGFLLENEKLWVGLWYCYGCNKYKPETAWDDFEYETAIRTKFRGHELEELVESCDEFCRRCRASACLEHFEGRELVRDLIEIGTWGEAIGFKRLGERSKVAKSKILKKYLNHMEYEALENHYERFEDVMRKLGI